METGVKKEEVLKRVGVHTAHLDHAVSSVKELTHERSDTDGSEQRGTSGI